MTAPHPRRPHHGGRLYLVALGASVAVHGAVLLLATRDAVPLRARPSPPTGRPVDVVLLPTKVSRPGAPPRPPVAVPTRKVARHAPKPAQGPPPPQPVPAVSQAAPGDPTPSPPGPGAPAGPAGVATAPTGEGIPLRLGAGGTGGGQGTGSPSLLLTPQAALRLTDPTRGPDGDQPRALQAPDLRLAPFLQRAHQSLQGHWRPAATLDQRFANRQVEQSGESESTVAVTINRSGSVLEVKLVGRSAHDFLDELALTTLRTARAFAHPPQALFGSQDSFRFLVTFRVRVILPVDRPEPYDPLLPPQAKELFRNPVFAALQQALQPIQEPTEYLTRKSLRDTPYPMCLRHEVGCRQGCAWDHLVFQAVYEPCAYAR